MKIPGPMLLLTVAMLPVGAVADSLAATQKAQTLCAGCHGPNGISTNPMWPNLAGQKDEYLAKAMRDYQTGARSDPNMTALAQTLTAEEIEDLAAYYAGLNPAG